ncbi:MAG TPA: AAA family ATPase [Streptosporangiaceae bacterium]|nr:AAA family ATPase [Streptosporangiaceae bacterium]
MHDFSDAEAGLPRDQAASHGDGRPSSALCGRAAERRIITGLLDQARGGRSGVLVIRGEAGIGKTALLKYAAGQAADMPVLRGSGVESEAELPFAGLHLILRPVLDRLGDLPPAQAAALRGALALPGGQGRPVDDRFLVGLGVLTVLSELAEDRPLLCLIDDAQWLDRASADALFFAARRLDAEGVVMLFATRDDHPAFEVPGLAMLRVAGLDDEAATELLAIHAGWLPPRTRDRVLQEAAGNPLALIELPAMLTPEQRSSELAPPAFHIGTVSPTSRVYDAYRARLLHLPEATQAVLLLAAADDSADLGAITRAAEVLGFSPADLEPAERAGLVHVGEGGVSFRHPLLRAAAYHSAALSVKLSAHRALAEVLDGDENADRRAWHRAAACVRPDPEVADELESAADRARTRTGYAAASSAYLRAAQLTVDREGKARRLVAAAEAAVDAGQMNRARDFAAQAARSGAELRIQARAARIRAVLEFDQGSPRAAHAILVAGARSIAAEEPAMAASMLVESVRNAFFAGDPASAGEAVAQLMTMTLPAGTAPPRFIDALGGLADTLAANPARGVPRIRGWLAVAGPSEGQVAVTPHRFLAAAMTVVTADDAVGYEQTRSLTADCRDQGAIGLLPMALHGLSITQIQRGRHRDAVDTATEGLRLAEDTGQSARSCHLRAILSWLSAAAGDRGRCHSFAEQSIGHAVVHQFTLAAAWGTWALALLDLGEGDAGAALTRFESAAEAGAYHPLLATLYAPDQVEAAVRVGRPDRAHGPAARFREWAAATGCPWAGAVAARCRALLSADGDAEQHYAEAVRLHELSGRPFEHARTRLAYGEWLRRQRRRVDARVQLAAALETFAELAAGPWAERARHELLATGATVVATANGAASISRLTPQELQVVRLAALGKTNREIAAQLFLSPRTVGYHLYKAYPKLGIGSRAELTRLELGERT